MHSRGLGIDSRPSDREAPSRFVSCYTAMLFTYHLPVIYISFKNDRS